MRTNESSCEGKGSCDFSPCPHDMARRLRRQRRIDKIVRWAALAASVAVLWHLMGDPSPSTGDRLAIWCVAIACASLVVSLAWEWIKDGDR